MTEVFKKLNYKNQDPVLVLSAPREMAKQTSKIYSSDLNRDSCASALAALGLQPVRQIAIDDDWSALRFKRKG
jgi:hypothetical protein